MIIRTAQIFDSDSVYNIANQDSVRLVSFSQNAINRADHKKWFENIIKKKNVILLIIIFEKVIVGYIRFDIKDKEAEISIVLLDSYQNRGLGKIALKKSIEILISKFAEVNYIIAFVLSENSRSTYFFEKNKFIYKGNSIIKSRKAKKYVYEIINK